MSAKTCKSDRHKTKSKITDYAKKVKYGRSDASLTVEAAMALPLLLFLMMTFLIWIHFFQTQEESMRKLNNRLRQMSGYACIAEEVIDSPLPEEIVLSDIQTLQFPIGLVTEEKSFVRFASLRMFTGRYYSGAGEESETQEEDIQVYLAETGSVYHVRADCTHLKLSTTQVSFGSLEHMRNQNGAIYYACEICVKTNHFSTGSLVYITKQGNRYHESKSCHGLLRKVRTATLKEAQAEGRRPCKRCASQQTE